MTTTDSALFIQNIFEEARPRFADLARRFVDDPDAVVDQAAAVFDAMIPEMAYREKPDHPMASAVFECSANLAVYLVLKERGVDAHRFGNAMLEGMASAPVAAAPAETRRGSRPASEKPSIPERLAAFTAIARASETEALPGEFVYETVFDDPQEFDWGMNVKSCAICSAYSKHDAMDLVPYMCATDDVVSDRENQGLRRTGTIAVGASHCDFRFKRGGDPLRLAPQYPDRVRPGDRE